MDTPKKMTAAYIKFLNKEMEKSILNLCSVAYANGVEDSAKVLEKSRNGHISQWGTTDAASEIRKLVKPIRSRKNGDL